MEKDTQELFCTGLPTKPTPENGKVLVTGATGYIGGRLVQELLARGYGVRTMLRAPVPGNEERWPGSEVAVADASNPPALRAALNGIHTAYYLIHSLLLGPLEFEAVDAAYARNFREAAEAAGVRRIIYLGGLGDVRAVLSPHLRSRMQVAEELQRGTIPTTVLRAAIIIGSGSASYEIVHHLVRNVPVIPVPPWGRTKCQPIAVRDVIRYLVGTLESPATAGASYDVGGSDVLTYELMLRILADVLGKRRFFVPVPAFLSHVGFYAYCAGLLTPVPAPIIASLMESLRNDVVCQDTRIRDIIPFTPATYREAVVDAMSREEQDEIHSRWTDAYPLAHELAMKLQEVKPPPAYVATYSLLTDKNAAALFRSICRIGGKEGWFRGNWLWRLRGALDRMLMGVGSARGRRSSRSLRVNDVIDFWRVEEIIPSRRLLLRAEMLLPGRAWLEFRIDADAGKNRLGVTAHYDTHTIVGRIYWYIFLPFHWYLFVNLLKQIDKRS